MDEINEKVWAFGGLVLLVCGFHFSSYWPLPLCAGAVLILWSKIAPSTTSSTDGDHTLMPRESEIQLPALWDERQIGATLEKYKDSPSVLGRYIDGILARFVVGQEQRTMETRTRYLETFNKYAEIARESYKWHRYMTGGRAKLEEDAEDTKAEAALREQQAKLELLDLDKEIQRAKKELELKKIQKEMEDLNKPAPPLPPAPPRQPSASEVSEQKRQSLKAREKRVRDEIQITQSDPTLSEEQRQRKLNALEEHLSEIHEEQVQLL